jgi:flagellin
MTRINTNVSSLVAQNTLGRSNSALEQALTRLSTGLRINTGKDDPAGLIASENLRSDITSIKRAIGNTDRANQVIATADSALGQVSGLLNDIRGLVTEAANSGGVSAEQIAANQSQIDSSLEALNRIAQTVTFQGRKLLDGSLDFITSAGSNFSRLSGLQIDQANLGTTGSVSVDIAVTTAATNAEVDIDGFAASTAAANATTSFNVTNAVAQATGTIALDTTGASGFALTAAAAGPAAGAAGNGFTGIVIADGLVAGTSYDANTGVLTVTTDIANGDDTTADVYAAINAGTDFVASALTGGTETVATTNTGSGSLVGGRNAGSTAITVTADTAGVNTKTVTLQEVVTGTANTATAALDGSGNIVVSINGTVAKSAIANAINNDITGYTASAVITGDANYASSSDSVPGVATLAGGAAASGGLTQAAVFELSGQNGSEVFSFGANTSIARVADAINLIKDATGVEATVNGTTLELTSTGYGSDAFVELKLISEATGGTISAAIGQGAREAGTDVVATVNGIAAKGRGNNISVNTSTLDLSTSVQAGFTGSIAFDITGGGALFQLGPDVVSNQQARIGITSVNTARLGGTDGVLYQLASGGTADLSSDPTKAALIIDEAITQITQLRGRLGAFQRTSLETNKNTLNDTLVNLTEAESKIRDADFAAESAALTRAQILVQSGTTVLQVANSNPQNVLALLR